MSIFQLQIPTQIQFACGVFATLELPDCRVLVLTGQQLLQQASDLAARKPRSAQVLLRPTGEPSSEAVDRLAAQADPQTELIIAIGGGSTLDAAKGVALLLGSGGEIADYEFGQRSIDRVVPIWAVPTTCGSGSEVTPYAVINNSKTGRKFTLGYSDLQPQRAIVDPHLLRGLAPQTFVSGCLDAFIHAFEARLSTRHNPLIDPLAESAMQLIWQHLATRGLLPQDDRVWDALAQASLYGGLSIAHTRTGLVHTLSVALAKYSSEPHGLLNARLLPYVLSFNQCAYAGHLARLMTKITGQAMRDDQQAAAILSNWLAEIIPGDFVLAPAASAGLTALADRVEQDKGLPGVNPRSINRENLISLLGEVVTDAT